MRKMVAAAVVVVLLIVVRVPDVLAAAWASAQPDGLDDIGVDHRWLWAAGGAAGAVVLAGLGATLWWMARGAHSPGQGQPPVASRPLPPTEPGEPCVASPFAVLPETRLVVLRGLPVEDRFYRVATSPFSVGAAPGNHLVVDAPHVSGQHATLELLGDGTVYLVDVSRNGTYVDGIRVPRGERVRVNHGQRIEFSRDVEVRLEQPWREAGVAARQAGDGRDGR